MLEPVLAAVREHEAPRLQAEGEDGQDAELQEVAACFDGDFHGCRSVLPVVITSLPLARLPVAKPPAARTVRNGYTNGIGDFKFQSEKKNVITPTHGIDPQVNTFHMLEHRRNSREKK